MKKILITGASGFVGRYVSEWPGAIPLDDSIDLRNKSALLPELHKLRPDYVVHLAAQSFVPDSIHNPRETFAVNFDGTLNLLLALREDGFAGRMLYVGSGDMYGQVPLDNMPVREIEPLLPRNPYAVSKVAAEALCYQWSQTESFEIVMARPFNHIGPYQSPRFVVAGFAQQIAEIRLSKRDAIMDVGDIDVTRDFSDVRDVVGAYRHLLEHGRSGEAYNVCSGKERSIRSILDQMIELSGVAVEVRRDPDRIRPAEQRRVWGSNEKIRNHTGWEQKYSIEQSLMDVLEYWERELK